MLFYTTNLELCTKAYCTRMHSSRMRTACSSSHWGDLPQCMLGYMPPAGCGPGGPPSVGLEDPSVGLETPQARPLNFPPGYEPGNLKDMLGYQPTPRTGDPYVGPGDPLQVWAWRPPRCGPGDPPGQTPQLPPGMSLET